MLHSPITPGQFDPPLIKPYCYRAQLHQVSITYYRMQTYQGQMYAPTNQTHDTRSLWSIADCMHTQAIGNLTYSDIGWSVFCSCLQKTSIMQDPESRQPPHKHLSWMNNWQVTQITYAALYKHENYFQSRPIHSNPSTSKLMYYDTKVLLSRNRQMYPPHTFDDQDLYFVNFRLYRMQLTGSGHEIWHFEHYGIYVD